MNRSIRGTGSTAGYSLPGPLNPVRVQLRARSRFDALCPERPEVQAGFTGSGAAEVPSGLNPRPATARATGRRPVPLTALRRSSSAGVRGLPSCDAAVGLHEAMPDSEFSRRRLRSRRRAAGRRAGHGWRVP